MHLDRFDISISYPVSLTFPLIFSQPLIAKPAKHVRSAEQIFAIENAERNYREGKASTPKVRKDLKEPPRWFFLLLKKPRLAPLCSLGVCYRRGLGKGFFSQPGF